MVAAGTLFLPSPVDTRRKWRVVHTSVKNYSRLVHGGPDASGIRGQVLAGSIVSGVGAFLALRFLVRYLQDHTRTLMPFAIYCLVAGIGSAVYLSLT